MTGLHRCGSLLSSAARGVRSRMTDAGWSVVETPAAAGLAWYIAHNLLRHHQPFFAPSAAALMVAVAGTATSPERLSDALIGGGVTLAITAVLFPAAPLPLIQDAARQVLAALRDTLGCLVETADTGKTPGREWALAAGQRIQTQLAGLHQARAAAFRSPVSRRAAGRSDPGSAGPAHRPRRSTCSRPRSCAWRTSAPPNPRPGSGIPAPYAKP
jgi:uncharacterized membrane protein YgaE (UPF0421/DUF939 family)